MKYVFILLLLLNFTSAMALDMSSTEDSNSAYIENSDGSLIYIGGCSLHEDYLDSRFTIKETLLAYTQGTQLDAENFKLITKHIDQTLLEQVAMELDLEWSENVDDLTIEEVVYLKSKQLKLYRLNIGIGGGNGMFVTYLRDNHSQKYTKMAHTFDGDLLYCDSIVWTN